MKNLLIICALLIGAFSYGQNVIGNAFSIKSLTSAQRDALNVTGRYPIIYNSTTSQYEKYNGASWENIEVNDLSSEVIWANIPDANVPESAVTQHEAALTIVGSNITDGTIDILDTDAGIQTSLGLADSALQTIDSGSDFTDGDYGDIVVTGSVLYLDTNSVTGSNISDGTITSIDVFDGTLDELDLDTSVNTSLDLADSATQPGDIDTFAELDALVADQSLLKSTGTPANNYLGVWTDANTLEGVNLLQFDGSTLSVLGTQGLDVTNNLLTGSEIELRTAATGRFTISNGTTDDFYFQYSNSTTDVTFRQNNAAETLIWDDSGGIVSTATIEVPDDAYAAGWNGNFDVPTKNAVYDKIETVVAGGGGLSSTDIDTSAEIAAIVTDETGSGALVLGTSPTLVTPALGEATATSINGAVLTSGILNGTVTGSNTGDQTITLTGDVTGTGTGSFATTIAADAVDESMLNMFNAPTNGYVFKYDSTNGMTWAPESGGGDIYLHPNSDVAIDSIYVGTTAQIAARPLGTDVLSFATDATIQLTDLTDVNTATVTNKFFLVADGVDFESRAITNADFTVSSELDLGANSIGSTAQSATGDGATTIDWGSGNLFNFTFGAFNETFTFTAPTKPGTFILKLVQDSVGSRTATWPGTVEWPGGAAPTLTTTATTGTDIITFYYDGTIYFAVSSLNFQ